MLVQIIDRLPESHLYFLKGTDQQLGVMEWLDAFEPMQLRDLEEVLGYPVDFLDDFLRLVMQHLMQLEDHSVWEGVELDGGLELLRVLGLKVLLVLLDELDQLPTGEVKLRVELLLPMEILQR